MGNWMTVQIVGTCDASDVPALKQALNPGQDYENFHCLCFSGGLLGLPNWAKENIDAVGNLAERDYLLADVANALLDISIQAPSLKVKVHCGGDNETTKCVATITLENRVAKIGDPEIEEIKRLSEYDLSNQMRDNLLTNILRQRGLEK